MAPRPPDLSLADLSETMLLMDAEAILQRLASYDCIVECPQRGWRQLSGGREYVTCVAGPVRISGLASHLSIEISRVRDDPSRGWVDSFELSPVHASDSAWGEAIRKLLSQTFEPISAGSAGGAEVYQRGSLEQGTLFPGATTQAARLILHRRDAVRAAG